jgi:tRNA(Arg) A34 adenosine deaminase TadA
MSHKRFAITAVIYDRKGRVLSTGQNSYVKTHPLQAKHAAKVGEYYKVFLHSEVHAITRCKDISKAFRIGIFRYDEAGNPVSAKPCKICLSAIKSTNIQIIEHT